MDVAVFAGFEAPFLLTRLRVERVKIAVPATDVDGVVRNCRRRMNDVAGSKLPLQNAGNSIHAVNVSITAADIDASVRDGGRRGVDVPRIGNRLEAGRIAVQPFAFEAPLVFGHEGPFQRACLRVESVENPVEAAEVDEAVGDRW